MQGLYSIFCDFGKYLEYFLADDFFLWLALKLEHVLIGKVDYKLGAFIDGNGDGGLFK
jgi:hypothetical protein